MATVFENRWEWGGTPPLRPSGPLPKTIWADIQPWHRRIRDCTIRQGPAHRALQRSQLCRFADYRWHGFPDAATYAAPGGGHRSAPRARCGLHACGFRRIDWCVDRCARRGDGISLLRTGRHSPKGSVQAIAVVRRRHRRRRLWRQCGFSAPIGLRVVGRDATARLGRPFARHRHPRVPQLSILLVRQRTRTVPCARTCRLPWAFSATIAALSIPG